MNTYGQTRVKIKTVCLFPMDTCAITGKKVSVMEAKGHPLCMNLDHEIPVARGGRNELSNAQLLKEKINSMKGDMTNEEFFDEIFDIFRADPFIDYVEKVKKCKILIKNK
jgi:5-methylcytosine-specific restriction endonuclease McrA